MTARDAFRKSYTAGTHDWAAGHVWFFATKPNGTGAVFRNTRASLRTWWQSLSEHEKLEITKIPLALLDEESSDWVTTTNRSSYDG